MHYVKHHNFAQFPGVDILWKGRVSAKFWVNCPKLGGRCAFPKYFHTSILGEITVFYTVVADLVVPDPFRSGSVPKTIGQHLKLLAKAYHKKEHIEAVRKS